MKNLEIEWKVEKGSHFFLQGENKCENEIEGRTSERKGFFFSSFSGFDSQTKKIEAVFEF